MQEQAVWSVMDATAEQVILAHKTKPPHYVFSENLLLLPVLVLASLAILLLSYLVPKAIRGLRKVFSRRGGYEPVDLVDDDDDALADEAAPPAPPPVMPSRGFASDFRHHVRSLRDAGSVLFALEVLRTLCIAALLGLSIWAAIQAEAPSETMSSWDVDILKRRKKKHKNKEHKGHHDKSTLDQYSPLELGEFGACAFYTYALIFSTLLLSLRPATPVRRHIIAHLDVLLLLGFALYAYRDIWPILTTYLSPMDIQNPNTWARLALLFTAAVLIPLIRPRTYTPADPLNPTPRKDIHPEQTAPLLFYVFYEFMTGLVWRAWKVPSLPYEEFHPLADYDRADHLYKLHVGNMDPYKRKQAGKKRRHLGLLILSAFRWQFLTTCIMCVIASGAEMSGSIAINRLLAYLETDGQDAKLRPIFWIGLLFVGPLVGSLSIQYYIFVMTRCLVRSEAILTQLLFDHSLRLRMKDATAEDEKKEDEAPANHLVPAITVEAATDSANGPAGEVAQEAMAQEGINGDKSDLAAEVNGNGNGKKAAGEPKDVTAPQQGLAGKINVLMAADVESITEGRDIPLVIVFAPIQVVLCIVFLYKVLSWSAFVGVFCIIITLPAPGMLTGLSAKYQNQRMAATDSRIDVVTEAVGALRMLKMFAWEERMKSRISDKRETELNLIWKRRLAYLATNIITNVIPIMTMAITLAVYTIVQKKELTASAIFSSMTVFELLKGVMGMVFYLVNAQVTAYVSLNRIDDFLHTSEMVDEFSEGRIASIKTPEQIEAEQNGLIRLKDASFSWGSKSGKDSPDFQLHLPDVTFVKGKINLITGPTGSGKSSLLKALIGELHFVPQQGSFFHLPREGGVSYAAQESWCLSETIKENILFGEPFDAERYNATIWGCGLEPDLKILDDGDSTELGEQGVTLSGGQKARVTLARAVYSPSQVVLLDDIFSALDTLTSRHIIDNLFHSDLMKGRTVILVTHHVHLAAPMADYMVTLNSDGSVRSAGPVEDCYLSDGDSDDKTEVAEEKKKGGPEQAAAAEEKKPATKLIKDEEKAEGRISRAAMIRFFSMFGGPFFWSIYFGLLTGSQALISFETYWLGLWARAYNETPNPEDVSVPFWLGMYLVLVLIGLVAFSVTTIIFNLGSLRASRDIHRKLVNYIFGSYIRFLDSTPVGRIISRFTKDIKNVDGPFTDTFAGVAETTISLVIKFVLVVGLVPIFSIPAVIIGVVGGILGELYIHSQLAVKREMSNAKSPLFSHFSAAINGIVSIRAYGAQEKLRAQAKLKADKYTRSATAFYGLNRWVTVRIDMLGSLFATLLAAFLVYGPRLDASTTGFALSQAIAFSSMILWWVRMVNELEVQGNSVERIEDYLVIDQEPAPVKEKQPPASWPTSGEIVLDKLSAKYFKDGPTVLDNLDVTIKSGEKVGIVGRTGSGKSTLALALLRLIPTTDSVRIDGVKTENINLHALRSNVTIIPQDPVLLSGTLRYNLDPFGDHDDAELNDAMQSSGLGFARGSSSSGAATPQRLTLDSPMAAGGSNLSQGQRQLVALARALVRNSKVFILDEATASVDFETDAVIQQSIRNLPNHCTVLTVAHRLATVMDYDKILVLGKGKVLEFDSPEALKNKKDSYFAQLVQAMDG